MSTRIQTLAERRRALPVLIVHTGMGPVEARPTADTGLYPWPGGRLYSAEQMHEMARQRGWRIDTRRPEQDGRIFRATWGAGTRVRRKEDKLDGR